MGWATWQKDHDQHNMQAVFGIVSRWQKWQWRKPGHCTNNRCVFGNNLMSTHGGWQWVNDLNWGNIHGDHIAIAARTYIKITDTSVGTYNFWTESDDGSYLLVNGRMVVNNDGLHGRQMRHGRTHLGVGTHEVRVGYFEHGGGANFKVYYQPPGGHRTIMDVNTNHQKFGTNTKIDWRENNGRDWDHWAVRQYGTIQAKGRYCFRTNSDDGSYFYVDGKRVVNNGGLHGPQWRYGCVNLDGTKQDFEATMFEHGGGANFQVQFCKPGGNCGHCNSDKYGTCNSWEWFESTTDDHAYPGNSLGCYSTYPRHQLGWRFKGRFKKFQDAKNACKGWKYISLECPTHGGFEAFCVNNFPHGHKMAWENCEGESQHQENHNNGANGHCGGPYKWDGVFTGGWHRGALYAL
jgi:hypothetical protein